MLNFVMTHLNKMPFQDTATTLAVTEYATKEDFNSCATKEDLTNKLLVGTSVPTTATCPAGCWYGVYED